MVSILPKAPVRPKIDTAQSPPTDEWKNKIESIHALELHSAVKGNEALTFTMWKDPGNVTLSASHRVCDPFIWNVYTGEPMETEKLWVAPGP